MKYKHADIIKACVDDDKLCPQVKTGSAPDMWTNCSLSAMIEQDQTETFRLRPQNIFIGATQLPAPTEGPIWLKISAGDEHDEYADVTYKFPQGIAVIEYFNALKALMTNRS